VQNQPTGCKHGFWVAIRDRIIPYIYDLSTIFAWAAWPFVDFHPFAFWVLSFTVIWRVSTLLVTFIIFIPSSFSFLIMKTTRRWDGGWKTLVLRIPEDEAFDTIRNRPDQLKFSWLRNSPSAPQDIFMLGVHIWTNILSWDGAAHQEAMRMNRQEGPHLGEHIFGGRLNRTPSAGDWASTYDETLKSFTKCATYGQHTDYEQKKYK
jgi:hypothetical protein